jgi:cytochrome b
MLIALTTQVVTGLCAESDDLFVSGPFSAFLEGETVITLTGLHHINAKILLVLVCLHILAAIYYLIWKRENLVSAMITGWKWVRR